MSSLFRRPGSVSCYFCQNVVSSSSSSTVPFDPSCFRCPYCLCWNRYDAKGQILGDDPAMRDEKLNALNFAKRGSPDTSHFPSVYSNASRRPKQEGFFCHSCQTNQTLLVNLLSNYLPAPEDPSYERRLADLPHYTASLQTRYPPVCERCLPGVEEEISRKDAMARSRLLGGALKDSRSRASTPTITNRPRRMVSGQARERRSLARWKVNGVLWVSTALLAVLVDCAGILQLQLPNYLDSLAVFWTGFVALSLAWSFWDPTYSLQLNSRVQGRGVRVEGRKLYIFLQFLAWCTRTSTACLQLYWARRTRWKAFETLHELIGEHLNDIYLWYHCVLAIEILVLLASYFSIRIHKPVPVRLIDTSVHRGLTPLQETFPSQVKYGSLSRQNSRASTPLVSSATITNKPLVSEPDLLSTLSLSSNPIVVNYATTAKPMFGQPSFITQDSQDGEFGSRKSSQNMIVDHDEEDKPDSNAMDWEPVSGVDEKKSASNSIELRQQKFFPPEEPTGLEGLLMRTRLVDEEGESAVKNRVEVKKWNWPLVYSVSIVPLVALLIALWLRTKMNIRQ